MRRSAFLLLLLTTATRQPAVACDPETLRELQLQRNFQEASFEITDKRGNEINAHLYKGKLRIEVSAGLGEREVSTTETLEGFLNLVRNSVKEVEVTWSKASLSEAQAMEIQGPGPQRLVPPDMVLLRGGLRVNRGNVARAALYTDIGRTLNHYGFTKAVSKNVPEALPEQAPSLTVVFARP